MTHHRSLPRFRLQGRFGSIIHSSITTPHITCSPPSQLRWVVSSYGGDSVGPAPSLWRSQYSLARRRPHRSASYQFHIDGLRQMGAEIVEENGRYHCTAQSGLHGTTIQLPFPSVMATENFLITASLAEGVTIIENAARNRKSSTLSSSYKRWEPLSRSRSIGASSSRA